MLRGKCIARQATVNVFDRPTDNYKTGIQWPSGYNSNQSPARYFIVLFCINFILQNVSYQCPVNNIFTYPYSLTHYLLETVGRSFLIIALECSQGALTQFFRVIVANNSNRY